MGGAVGVAGLLTVTGASSDDVLLPTAEQPRAAAQPAADPCEQGEPPTAPEASASCLYAAFGAGDRVLAGRYATPEAVSSLFGLDGDPAHGSWRFDGCAAQDSSPPGGVSCYYLIPGDAHPNSVEMVVREDLVVERVLPIG